MALLMVSIYNRFCAIVKEEMQNSGLTLQPSAVMVFWGVVVLTASASLREFSLPFLPLNNLCMTAKSLSKQAASAWSKYLLN